ncbi:mitochondrial ATP-binding cassette sub-family B member 6 [Colletotrichum filicis]|nr:mitochondrial ATP-binding cassette sub-family B member 6 [Colletotrichum filicis]
MVLESSWIGSLQVVCTSAAVILSVFSPYIANPRRITSPRTLLWATRAQLALSWSDSILQLEPLLRSYPLGISVYHTTLYAIATSIQSDRLFENSSYAWKPYACVWCLGLSHEVVQVARHLSTDIQYYDWSIIELTLAFAKIILLLILISCFLLGSEDGYGSIPQDEESAGFNAFSDSNPISSVRTDNSESHHKTATDEVKDLGFWAWVLRFRIMKQFIWPADRPDLKWRFVLLFGLKLALQGLGILDASAFGDVLDALYSAKTWHDVLLPMVNGLVIERAEGVDQIFDSVLQDMIPSVIAAFSATLFLVTITGPIILLDLAICSTLVGIVLRRSTHQVLESLLFIGCMAGMLVVIKLVLDGRATPGDFFRYPMYWSILSQPLERLRISTRDIVKKLQEADEVRKLLERTTKDGPKLPKLEFQGGELEFRNVTFRRGQQTILEDFSHRIPAGTKTALVGPSGVGKSTLLALVTGQEKPDSGEILIDNQNIEEVDIDSLRGYVGIIEQDPFIFNCSVKDNLKYAKRDATDEQMKVALQKASLDDVVSQRPKKYDTPTGANGRNFSGGEKQRLNFGRLFLNPRSIVLIDEGTSALDAETEWLLKSNLSEALSGTTCIFVAFVLLYCPSRRLQSDNVY